MASSQLFLLSLFLLQLLLPLNLASNHGPVERVLENGYTVKTLIDGHKQKINPHAVLPRPGSSDLIVLDSVNSVFYTLSFPISEGSEVKRLSGKGEEGYSDGEVISARFRKPRSFAVDLTGNVYVADQANHAIRKITKSGVSTIAGGFSNKTGNKDGPAQNATFSNELEMVFVPQICALLISDRGNQLVRQIDLNPQDCATPSPSGLGAVSLWVIGLVASCLLGLVIGLAIRPYIIPYEGSRPLRCPETWKHCLISSAKQVLMLFFVSRSAIARSTLYTLSMRLFWLTMSHLSLMFSINYNTVSSQCSNKDFVSLLDSDVNSCEVNKSPQMFVDELKDLISCCNGCLLMSNPKNEILKQGEGNEERNGVLLGGNGRIDGMIQANIMGFAKVAKETTSMDDGSSSVGSLGLIKRR